MEKDIMKRLEEKLDELIKEMKEQNDCLAYQNKLLEILTKQEMIQNQMLIKDIYDSTVIPPEQAFMINVNANLWASLFQKYYWGENNE